MMMKMDKETREELKNWTVYCMIEGNNTFMEALIHSATYLELNGVSFDGAFQQEVVSEVNNHHALNN
jgi:hypothetical protein